MREGVLKPLAEAYQFSQARSQALGSPADDSHAVGLVAVARLVLADEAHWRQVLGLDPMERVTAAAKRLHERFTAEVAPDPVIQHFPHGIAEVAYEDDGICRDVNVREHTRQRILDTLSETQFAYSPRELAEDLQLDINVVRQQIFRMKKAGVVRVAGNGAYFANPDVAGHMLIDAPAPYGPPRSLEQRIAERAALSRAEGVE